jgi:hypothetical protein
VQEVLPPLKEHLEAEMETLYQVIKQPTEPPEPVEAEGEVVKIPQDLLRVAPEVELEEVMVEAEVEVEVQIYQEAQAVRVEQPVLQQIIQGMELEAEAEAHLQPQGVTEVIPPTPQQSVEPGLSRVEPEARSVPELQQVSEVEAHLPLQAQQEAEVEVEFTAMPDLTAYS